MNGAVKGAPARLVFDLTTTALWSGPPAGIVRVEREFARWALAHVDGLALGFFDPEVRAFRRLHRNTADILIAQQAALDTFSFVNPARRGKRKTDRIPVAVRPAAIWILQFRRTALQAMERLRLTTDDPRIAVLTDRLQRAIMTPKYRALMVKPDGSRRRFLPVDSVLGAPLALAARDTLVDVEAQRRYCELAFPAADLVIFGSRTVAADVRAFCDTRGIALGAWQVCPLGANDSASAAQARLPAGIEAGRYALLVSTIEPRKGHRLIYDAWVKLIEAGIPQRSRFKLVFAGRKGWMVDDLMRDLRSDPRIAGTLELLADADDATVSALYRDAAFCLYPSRYEGYGLPVVEAFRHGKAVLASTGGAVPEVVGGFSPCLDPTDREVWQRLLATWIEDPAARAVYETRIRTSFRHPDWDEAARTFFELTRHA